MAIKIVRFSTDYDHAHASVDSHVDKSILQPSTVSSYHVDRIIMAAGHTGAGTDDVSKLRLYTMVDDLPPTDLSAAFPDDNDPNIWFKQVIYGSTPIYVSWRPKRTIKGGEILYLDTNAVQFAAAREVYGYIQILYHIL